MKKIFALYKKYEELVNYLVVGVMTTVVSWAAYAVCKLIMDVDNAVMMQIAVVVRWVAGVVFGYFTNRRFVFKSKNPNMLREGIDFAASRLVTLFLDMFVMWLLPTVFSVNDWIATFVSAVLVTVMNYIFSKFIVFRKKKG
ncbi:MAG: GtrA family protein [Lachnospiraceae bacterium]|nr:GtrA family protein [Lachnospiraceae bacterium]